MNKPEVKQLLQDALKAWQVRDGFVEELKNDYVVSYFWVRYNNLTRPFNNTENLEKLSGLLSEL
jgi:hypothetical protein